MCKSYDYKGLEMTDTLKPLDFPLDEIIDQIQMCRKLQQSRPDLAKNYWDNAISKIKAIEGQGEPIKEKWISVEDGLPEDGDVVDAWVYARPGMVPKKISEGYRKVDVRFVRKPIGDNGELIGIFEKTVLGIPHQWIPENYDVTHWRPTPTPPLAKSRKCSRCGKVRPKGEEFHTCLKKVDPKACGNPHDENPNTGICRKCGKYIPYEDLIPDCVREGRKV